MMDRRNLFKTAAAAAIVGGHAWPQSGGQAMTPSRAASTNDAQRRPDSIFARTATREMLPLQFERGAWTTKDIRVSAEVQRSGNATELPVFLECAAGNVTHLHLRWLARGDEARQFRGDAWERSYGDLAWQHTDPRRVMPWYFLVSDGRRVHGYGVRTQAAALCFWQADTDGISLWIDIRNGGEAVQLGSRRLHACTVVTLAGGAGEPLHAVARRFCERMCPSPRLPQGALYGSNDWNYAYGRNSADGTLRDADLIASLAPAGSQRPSIVIDDGWRDAKRFPDMRSLAAKLTERNVQPGLWIRPLLADRATAQKLLLPAQRFGSGSPRQDLALDPTIPEALELALATVRQPRAWGYTFLKHDFSTYDLFGRWGFEMGADPTVPGWHPNDRTRTNAEIVNDLYAAIRTAAGDATVLACNTVGHLAAGVFESQRTGDDTSGRDWERTRRMGVNTLAHRVAQHRTFFHLDPDIVAITNLVPRRQTQQWMDFVARSGTSLFFAPGPDAVDAEMKASMRDAMAQVVQSTGGHPVDAMNSTTPQEWMFSGRVSVARSYRWGVNEGSSPFST